MTRKVNIAEAKARLSELAEAANRGEEIVIARNGKPFARLVPLAPASRKPRKFGKYEPQSKHIDWDKWWSDWKDMDRETEQVVDASPLFPGMAAGDDPPFKAARPATPKRRRKPRR